MTHSSAFSPSLIYTLRRLCACLQFLFSFATDRIDSHIISHFEKVKSKLNHPRPMVIGVIFCSDATSWHVSCERRSDWFDRALCRNQLWSTKANNLQALSISKGEEETKHKTWPSAPKRTRALKTMRSDAAGERDVETQQKINCLNKTIKDL